LVGFRATSGLPKSWLQCPPDGILGWNSATWYVLEDDDAVGRPRSARLVNSMVFFSSCFLQTGGELEGWGAVHRMAKVPITSWEI
jgi:hypothetical protein